MYYMPLLNTHKNFIYRLLKISGCYIFNLSTSHAAMVLFYQ
jgi:hypothetical protein